MRVLSLSSPTEQLEELLGEPTESAAARQRSLFDECTAPFQNRLVLFGAGRLGRRTLSGLRQLGIEPLAFADNNQALWGREIEGAPVISPEQAAHQYRNCAAFVVTIWNGEASDTMADRIAQLTALGCEKVVPFAPLFWQRAELFLPYYFIDCPTKVLMYRDLVKAAYSLLADDESRREYVGQIAFRLLLDFDSLGRPAAGERYFSSGLFRFCDEEVMVDCGAFDGDTLTTFVNRRAGRFASIKAFEPDPANWLRLQERIAALPDQVRRKIRAARKAVGGRPEPVRFNAIGTVCSSVGEGSLLVDCVRLDDVLEGCEPTLIKFDIEGSELDALAGAANTISEHLPVLAVSAYHEQDHLWRIPLLISSLSDQYRFFIRPEGCEGWDLTCYAVPGSRLAATQSGSADIP